MGRCIDIESHSLGACRNAVQAAIFHHDSDTFRELLPASRLPIEHTSALPFGPPRMLMFHAFRVSSQIEFRVHKIERPRGVEIRFKSRSFWRAPFRFSIVRTAFGMAGIWGLAPIAGARCNHQSIDFIDHGTTSVHLTLALSRAATDLIMTPPTWFRVGSRAGLGHPNVIYHLIRPSRIITPTGMPFSPYSFGPLIMIGHFEEASEHLSHRLSPGPK